MNSLSNKELVQSGETGKHGVWANIFDNSGNTLVVREGISKGHKRENQISVVAGSLEKGEDYIAGSIREILEEVGLEITKEEITTSHTGQIIVKVFDDSNTVINEIITSVVSIHINKKTPSLHVDRKELAGAEWMPINKLTQLLKSPHINGEVRPGTRPAFLNPDNNIILNVRNGKLIK